ncbi:MAG TPA: hypothetical protein VGE07_00670 [Herpetosiphonaceae bacterium]
MWVTLGEITAIIIVAVVFFRIGVELAPVVFRWVADLVRPPADDERIDDDE